MCSEGKESNPAKNLTVASETDFRLLASRTEEDKFVSSDQFIYEHWTNIYLFALPQS